MSETNPQAMSQRGKWFVLSVVFLDMVGIGIAFPSVPIFLELFVETRAQQAQWFGIIAASYGLMQFLCAPVLGAVSDRFGRRVVLIAALIGLGFHYIIIATAVSVWIVLLARMIGGITGASFSVANAYLADVSTPADRAKNFGMVGAAFGLGFIFGPAIGGVLGEIDPYLPFYVAAALSFANGFYGYLVVPESLPRENRTAFSLAKSNPFRSLANLVRSNAVGSLVIAFALFTLAHMTMIQTWVLYTRFRFNWGTLENGLLLACVGLLSLIVQGGLIGRLVKRFGEERLALTAIGVNVFVQIAYGTAQSGWMMYPILFCGFLIFTAGPAMQGVVSKATDASAQGVTLGSLQSINSLALVLGPLMGNWILQQVADLPSTDFRIGASFFFCAALNVAAFILLAWRLRRSVVSSKV